MIIFVGYQIDVSSWWKTWIREAIAAPLVPFSVLASAKKYCSPSSCP